MILIALEPKWPIKWCSFVISLKMEKITKSQIESISQVFVNEYVYCITCKKRAEKTHNHNLCDYCDRLQCSVDVRHYDHESKGYIDNLILIAESTGMIDNSKLLNIACNNYEQRSYFKLNKKNFCENCKKFSYNISKYGGEKIHNLDGIIVCKWCLRELILEYKNEIISNSKWEDLRPEKYGGPK